MKWLFCLYPASLIMNKTANDVVSGLILLAACASLALHRSELKACLAGARRMWLLALALPLLMVAIQYFALPEVMALRDLDDMSRFFLCIPVYLALLLLRPDIRPFLSGCAFFTVYSMGLMAWHIHGLGLDRGIAPNGFLATIPQTSLSIILSMVALRLWVGPEGALRRRAAPVLLLAIAFCVPLLSQTRSGLVLALVLGIMLWLLLPNKNLRVLLVSVTAAAAVMLVVMTNSSLWARGDQTVAEIERYMTEEHFVSTSTTTRLELWRFAGRMFAEHPLIGVGNHQFASKLASYKSTGETPAALELFTHPHNEFLKFAAEGGALGVLAISLLYFVPLSAGMRRYRRRPSALSPALPLIVLCSGFLLASMVDVVLAWRPTIMFYGLAASLLLATMDNSAEPAA
ncbi:MAG: O-antigen ligase family protein [Noviherbaspirillum sp.]